MQLRYCLCGRPIWVQYLFNALNCASVFLDADDPADSRLSHCPNCRRRLDINNLG